MDKVLILFGFFCKADRWDVLMFPVLHLTCHESEICSIGKINQRTDYLELVHLGLYIKNL